KGTGNFGPVDHTHGYLPAFLSFLFLKTERMTRRLPRISTTMVKMRMAAKAVGTQGGRCSVSSSGKLKVPFRALPLTLMFQPIFSRVPLALS
ncbi:hypothetical protein XELAEV_18009107mg, partial [Xenopus laevis]